MRMSRVMRSPPGAYSMARWRRAASWKHARRATTCGDLSPAMRASTVRSSRACPTWPRATMSALSSDFSASNSPVARARTSRTSPTAPRPSVATCA